MEPQNGAAVRIANLERAVHRLERLEPAVVKQQVEDLRAEQRDIHDELSAIRRILIGFLITFAFAGVSATVAIVTLIYGGA